MPTHQTDPLRADFEMLREKQYGALVGATIFAWGAHPHFVSAITKECDAFIFSASDYFDAVFHSLIEPCTKRFEKTNERLSDNIGP